MTETDDTEGIVETTAKAIYDSWWEDGEQFESARWENLEPDDYDRVSALKAARVALAGALPVLLADLAEKIDGQSVTVDDALAIVRSFASEVSRG